MVFGAIWDVIETLLTLPIPSTRPKSHSGYMQLVFGLAIWLVLIAAIALGLWSYFRGE